MLTRAQEKMIKSLHRKKGRVETGFCLVEGEKLIDTIPEDQIEFRFTHEDTDRFVDLVTTKTPQDVAAVALAPEFELQDVLASPTVIILDGVQDPGNVGAIFRLCHGFNATLFLIESADPTSSKVIRSSVGSMFHVPWVAMTRPEAFEVLQEVSSHQLLRLERREGAETVDVLKDEGSVMLVVGSEGQGIQLSLQAPSLYVDHNEALESLNVGNAVAIALYNRYQS